MVRSGFSNAEAIELKRQELAGAVTRIVVNQALSEAKARAKVRDETMNKSADAPKIILDEGGNH
jgi:hypothetical protein